MAEEEGGKEIEQIIKMEMEARKVRFEGLQGINKANKEGFAVANESAQKASESRTAAAFKRSASDGVDLSKETQKSMGG
ncbi:MAG: hypothetical protein RDV48_00225 [Candidatus Eremiobacteraeota bacterium]|nr:hypothetical protein [Candidatus Eremiobacteraeota bacterium]